MKREIAMMMDEEEEEEHNQPCQKSILFDRIGENQFNNSLYALMKNTCCRRHMSNRPNVSKLQDMDMECCQIRNLHEYKTPRKYNHAWRLYSDDPDCTNTCYCPCRHYLRYYLQNKK